MSDGQILIDSKLDTQGVQKGTDEIQGLFIKTAETAAKARADKEITAAKQSAAERSPLASPRTWTTVLTPTRRWPQEPERSCSTSSRDW